MKVKSTAARIRSHVVAIAGTASALLFGGAAPAAASPNCVARPFTNDPLARGFANVELPPDFRSSGPLSPTRATGNVHLLVILAEFSDRAHRVDPSRFEELLFGSSWSLRDYYDEVSGGKLDVTGDLHGWVTLPQTQFYYSQNAQGVGADYPNNAQRMTEDAIVAALGTGLDLADYDADRDGFVDALLVIHAGQGWEWAGGPGNSTEVDPSSIVSHKWVLPNQEFGSGARVAEYFTCPELQLVPAWSDSISTIGVYCHEFGHILGLPDYYDSEGAFVNHVGVWDLMDYGNWNRLDRNDPVAGAPGASPAHLSAWSKMFLGWTEPETLAPGTGERIEEAVRLSSATTGSPPLQLLPNPNGVDWENGRPGRGEFFLAEVRTRDGYDASLPTGGLLLYHVDESRRSNRASQNPDSGRLLMLRPRDGQTSLGPSSEIVTEVWPGGGESRFDDDSDPSSRLHDGSSSGVSLVGITPGPIVSFLATVENLRSPLPVPFARPNPWSPALHGELRLVLSLEKSGGEPGRVLVFDGLGRRVRTLDSSTDFGAEDRLALWDGRSDDGTRAAAGMYFFRFEGSAGSSRAGRVILVR